MMTQDREYEDILRRALAAAAESIEPTGDGLQRIRHRLDSRQSTRSFLPGCAEWLELHGTRLLVRFEPAIEWGRTALKRALPVLASFPRGLSGPRTRAGGHRGPARPRGRLGPAGAWLKPVFAVSAAVAIVVAGVVILNHETQTVISPLNSYNPSGRGTSVGSGGRTADSKRWKLPLGVFPPTQQANGQAPNPKMKTNLPAVACTLTPTPTPTPSSTTTAPAGSVTATPTPTATGSATGTPATPQPTETTLPTPTPTDSAATGGTSTGGTSTGGTSTGGTSTGGTSTGGTSTGGTSTGGTSTGGTSTGGTSTGGTSTGGTSTGGTSTGGTSTGGTATATTAALLVPNGSAVAECATPTVSQTP